MAHNAVMTDALLPWYRDSPFKSEVLSDDDTDTGRRAMLSYRTDTEAQGPKLLVITR